MDAWEISEKIARYQDAIEELMWSPVFNNEGDEIPYQDWIYENQRRN
jgi:hypothetical protein